MPDLICVKYKIILSLGCFIFYCKSNVCGSNRLVPDLAGLKLWRNNPGSDLIAGRNGLTDRTNHPDLQRAFSLAREYKSRHMWDRAVEILQQANDPFPENPHILVALADTYLEMGSLPEAYRTIRQLILNWPANGYIHHLLASLAERTGKIDTAIRHYRLALQKDVSRKLVLSSLVKLLLNNSQARSAVDLLEPFSDDLQGQDWFILLLSEALSQAGKPAEALQLTYSALKLSPGNKLFLHYLYLRYRFDAQDPLITYHSLKRKNPKLPDLTDRELRNLHIDYLIYSKMWGEAEKLLREYISLMNDKLHWTCRLIDLKEKIGHDGEFESIAEKYFLGNPSDIDMASRLEKFYTTAFRQQDWFALLRRTFQRHPASLGLFSYLRNFYQGRDWLQNSTLHYGQYLLTAQQIETSGFPWGSQAWRKVPSYVFEYFCLHFNLTEELPSPEKLYQNILSLRGDDGNGVSFTLEELRQSYPVWIFALHFYFLFKSFARITLSFQPRYFYEFGIGLILKLPRHTVAIDISPIMDFEPASPLDWFEHMDIKIMRWPRDFRPASDNSGIPLFRATDLPFIISLIESQLYTFQKGIEKNGLVSLSQTFSSPSG